MKNKLPLLARLILLFLLVSSCQTEHDDVEPAKAESLLVQQARQHFESVPQLQHNTEAPTNSKQKNIPYRNLLKDIVWAKAQVRQLSIGEAVTVPLTYSEEFYATPRGSNKKLPLSELSYLLLYKNKTGEWQTEVVYRLPDIAYINNAGPKVAFTGTVVVVDMKGEFLRGFSYSKGSIKRIAAPTWAPAPSETEIQAAGSSVSVEGNTPISSDDCVIIDWYSCTDMCYYMYTEYRNCSVDDGGWIDDGGGYPTGDDYGNGSLGPTPETGSSTSHIDNLIKVSTLSVDQYNLLKNAFNEMMQNCIGTSIYSALVNNSTKLNFNMNSQQTSVGRFDPRSLTITFKNNESIGWRALQEELFHSYQNIYYAGGIAQYSDYGSANIEFEAKLLQDILGLVEGQGSATAIAGHEYYYWLLNITNDGSKFPSNYSEIQNEYFHFLQQFPQQNSGYTSTTIRGGLLPNAMFNVISNSNCSK